MPTSCWHVLTIAAAITPAPLRWMSPRFRRSELVVGKPPVAFEAADPNQSPNQSKLHVLQLAGAAEAGDQEEALILLRGGQHAHRFWTSCWILAACCEHVVMLSNPRQQLRVHDNATVRTSTVPVVLANCAETSDMRVARAHACCSSSSTSVVAMPAAPGFGVRHQSVPVHAHPCGSRVPVLWWPHGVAAFLSSCSSHKCSALVVRHSARCVGFVGSATRATCGKYERRPSVCYAEV